MVSPVPQPVIPKSGTFQQESNTFASINDLFRFLQPARLRASRNSPPVLNRDITEGQLLLDKTALRIYTVVDGSLRYWSLT